ncbi:hypothetical protein UFOVP78_3 [uncultured Caudovirales phage]|uniref:Uncharacterized protein n=1 Tax=uncultured Caudovirales phage TaxID=2100421 RepID=A0A6J5KZC2_9CAUD|nr:hypothetical protein UFOVP78_3 [uncultured Caudovirales phage]
MPRARSIQTNFTGGEFSPRLFGRPDLDAYANGAATMLNFLTLPQGGATRRPGSYYVAGVKNSANKVRLINFTISSVAAYVIELGPLYARFYRNRGQVVDGSGVPVELVTPWAAADLPYLRWAQSADVLVVTHKSYAPQQITRTSASAFTIAPVNFQNGPYQPENTGDVGTAGGMGDTSGADAGVHSPGADGDGGGGGSGGDGGGGGSGE